MDPDWKVVGETGEVLVYSNALLGSLEKTVEFLKNMKNTDMESVSNQVLRVVENMLLLEQGTGEQQYQGLMGLMGLVRDTDEYLCLVLTLLLLYFKRQGFKDRSSHGLLVQIANAKSDVYGDVELEMLKTYTLKYAYSVEPFDLLSFFQDYPEEEVLYPLYQFY